MQPEASLFRRSGDEVTGADEVVAVSGGRVWPCFPAAWEEPNFHGLDEIRLTSRRIVRPACLGRLGDAVSRSGRIHQIEVTFEETCRLFFLIQDRKRSDYQLVSTTGTKSMES
jgi:hypothetical protein